MPVERSVRSTIVWTNLTEDEAEELLKIYGHQDKTKEFLVACPLAAFFCFVLS